ncbi:serine/threonine protein kinase [Pedobacter sp. GR22-10]|uniref:serine/threonine protein kinase n=1 Tax=Pedobacter sp. GR22-10 TaxID=2994472 RepID=UPI0022486372|nr:protein kinase [Pedobacter sp. GR22-10]MCX2429607.1 protein kinase [Pedobacter sp. GR22-10]
MTHSSPALSRPVSNVDFSQLLLDHGLSWELDGYYLLCGDRITTETHKMYFSVVVSQIPAFLSQLIPVLASEQISFAVVKDEQSAITILNGLAGAAHVGKVLMIPIPKDLDNFLSLIGPVLTGFRGPVVPGKCRLAGHVYIDREVTGLKPDQPKVQVLAGKYLVLSSLKKDPKGEVLKALYLSGWFCPKRCIIKEGKALMICDAALRDMGDRLKWQAALLNRLEDIIAVPLVLELFTENGNTYLVLERVSGQSMGKVIEKVYGGKDWSMLKRQQRFRLIAAMVKILSMVEQVHLRGLLHRDLSTANFLLDQKGDVYLIDWELAFDLQRQYPLPPFGFGTPGFISPEQNLGKIPTVKEDIYGLSALMLSCFTGIKPREFRMEDNAYLKAFVLAKTEDQALAEVIARGLKADPDQRPVLSELQAVVENMPVRINAGSEDYF